MAEVDFPSAAGLASFAIEPWVPGQIVLRSPFTGSIQILNRGYASWRGAAEIAPEDATGETTAKAIEAFLASLEGQENWTALPLDRPTVAAGTTGTVETIANALDGTISHRLVSSITVAIGDWLVSGTRCYLVRDVDSQGDELTLDPQIPLAVGDTLGPATTIRARAQQTRSRPMRRTRDFWGPWRFDWEEAF